MRSIGVDCLADQKAIAFCGLLHQAGEVVFGLMHVDWAGQTTTF
jgi:hypothetical protein